MDKKLFGALIATALMSTVASAEGKHGKGDAHKHADKAAAAVEGYCQNNKCKGASTCQTADNACKGQNTCKGMGKTGDDEKACKSKKLKWVAASH